ncbi:hypothetical protein Q9966_003150 [Columba livia]|nr:hypothetical protein Q9966_003150 [Columba livia]
MCSEIILGRVTNTLNLTKALRLSDMPAVKIFVYCPKRYGMELPRQQAKVSGRLRIGLSALAKKELSLPRRGSFMIVFDGWDLLVHLHVSRLMGWLARASNF